MIGESASGLNPSAATAQDGSVGATPSGVQIAIQTVDGKPMIRRMANSRGGSLTILALIASVFALQAAGKFFVPLLIGIIMAYTLNPLVLWLQHKGVRRGFGATLVMTGMLCAAGFVLVSIQGQAETILIQLPQATSKVSALLRGTQQDEPTMFERVRDAANEVVKASKQVEGSADTKHGPQHVVVDNPTFRLSDLMWAGSRGVAGAVGQIVMVLFLVYFLLLSGDIFKRKLVRLTGPSLSRKKITVQLLDDIDSQIQRYMFAILVTNLLLAALSWMAFRWIGLENAGAWAVAAGLLHLVPYFGPMLIAVATGAAGFMQSGSLSMGLLAAGCSLAIAAVVGVLITTWMTGKAVKMNPAAVFVALLFWTWLWGIWGALLAIPITGIVKVICHRVEPFQPMAELLSD